MRNCTSKELSRWFVLICVLRLGSVISNCTEREKLIPSSTSQNTPSTSSPDSSSTLSPIATDQDTQATAELLALVKRFAEGESGDDEWRKLQSYPREQLIESLLSLQKSVPEDDLLHYSIAFTFASLNYQYADNVKVLNHSLSPKPNGYADDDFFWLTKEQSS